MKKGLNSEMIEKAKAAKSAEEMQTLAKENELELSIDEAKAYFDRFHKTGELSDDELGSVAGGGCHTKDGRLVVSMGVLCDLWKHKECGGTEMTEYKTCVNCKSIASCTNCVYLSKERGLWLCNRDENRC